MKTYSFFALCVLITVFISCQKDESSPPPSKTELITSATWKYDTAGIDSNNDGTIDSALPPGIIEDCDKDNTITFNSNGSGTADEGPTKCDPANPQTTPFTWSFNSNETAITFSDSLFSGIDGNVNIQSLTETNLQLSKEVTIFPPITANVVIRMKH